MSGMETVFACINISLHGLVVAGQLKIGKSGVDELCVIFRKRSLGCHELHGNSMASLLVLLEELVTAQILLDPPRHLAGFPSTPGRA